MVTGSFTCSSSGRRLEDKTTSPPLVLSWLHVGRGRPFVAPAHRGPSSSSSVRPAGAPLWHRVAFHPGAVALLLSVSLDRVLALNQAARVNSWVRARTGGNVTGADKGCNRGVQTLRFTHEKACPTGCSRIDSYDAFAIMDTRMSPFEASA